jgi:hypothetical protein
MIGLRAGHFLEVSALAATGGFGDRASLEQSLERKQAE